MMKLLRTLHGRLVFVLGGALLIGLLLMGFASVALLHHSLISRIDQQLTGMSRPWAEGLRPPPIPPPDQNTTGSVPTDFRVLFFDPGGRQIGMLGQTDDDRGGPQLVEAPQGPHIASVPDDAGGASWRVRTIELPDGDTIALALSLSSAHATVNQLIMIEVVVGAVVLIVLVAAATVTVRLSLRPLTRIEQTADAIAAGELQRRVPEQDPRTETGRLGAALNTMLGRLVDALQQREHSEQRLRRFVADASHELRTPLTSIRGFAELFRRSDHHRDDETRTMMGRIEAEATRMGRLVEDLLLLARLDRERTIDLTDIDLMSLVQDVVQNSRARDSEREIIVQGPHRPLRTVGDSHRLRQVVTNLVNNALVHTTPGTPITVEVSHSSADAAAVAVAGGDALPGTPMTAVSVADQGPGIPSEHAHQIFDRFYRVDNGRAPGGSGLGLAISAAIAEAHNGRIELHPNAEGGSTFRLLLPLS